MTKHKCDKIQIFASETVQRRYNRKPQGREADRHTKCTTICILSHLCFVTFVFCRIVYCHFCVLSFCVLSYLRIVFLYFVGFAFCLFAFCRICILSFCILSYLYFVFLSCCILSLLHFVFLYFVFFPELCFDRVVKCQGICLHISYYCHTRCQPYFCLTGTQFVILAHLLSDISDNDQPELNHMSIILYPALS